MIVVKRFFDPKLAQVSYLIGSSDTGQAVVIDATRDLAPYLEAAAAEGLSITHVTETHIHADYLSGSRELAQRTGARLFLSDEGDADWKYAFAASDGATLLHDGDTFDVGSVQIRAWHTPGHTPEHLTFIVTDTSVTSEPVAAVTGDFLFAGDVGRPDLLEKAARVAGSAEAAAHDLYRSLQGWQAYPDHLQIWPGHGAGSACGKGIGSLPQSTLGYERRTNWALKPLSEAEFVERVLSGQPDPPTYFAEMKRRNKLGPDVRRTTSPDRLSLDRLRSVLADGGLVIDTRSALEFGAAHIPGTLNIPLSRAFTTWAGWLVPYDRDVHLLIDDHCAQCVSDAMRDLAMIGLDRVAGFAGADVLDQWPARVGPLGRIAQFDARSVARLQDAGEAAILDVRSDTEWQAGHIPDALHVPLGALPARLEALPRDRPLVVHCQGGTRSAIAASVLDAAGFTGVMNMAGGFNEWQAAGLPVTPPA
ncbi:MBL fold metallo-hydrolase [Luteitalea sp.]